MKNCKIKYYIISLLLILGCQEYSESDHSNTVRICNSLELEVYSVPGGALASNTRGYVLNDSNGHREELFVIREDELIHRSFCFDSEVIFVVHNTISNIISKSVIVSLDGDDYSVSNLPLKFIKMKVDTLQDKEQYSDSLKIKESNKIDKKRTIHATIRDKRFNFEIEKSRNIRIEKRNDDYFLFIFDENKIESIVIL